MYHFNFKLIRLQKMMYVLACVGALCVVVCYGTYSTVHGAKGVEYRLSVCTCTVYTLLVFSLIRCRSMDKIMPINTAGLCRVLTNLTRFSVLEHTVFLHRHSSWQNC